MTKRKSTRCAVPKVPRVALLTDFGVGGDAPACSHPPPAARQPLDTGERGDRAAARDVRIAPFNRQYRWKYRLLKKPKRACLPALPEWRGRRTRKGRAAERPRGRTPLRRPPRTQSLRLAEQPPPHGRHLQPLDALGRVELLRAGLHAVRDRVAAVGAALVVPGGQAHLAGLVA